MCVCNINVCMYSKCNMNVIFMLSASGFVKYVLFSVLTLGLHLDVVSGLSTKLGQTFALYLLVFTSISVFRSA